MTSSLSFKDKVLECKGVVRAQADQVREWLAPTGPLVLRLWVAQEFLQAGYIKLAGGLSAPEWFAALTFPLPVRWLPVDASWVMAGLAEVVLEIGRAHV